MAFLIKINRVNLAADLFCIFVLGFIVLLIGVFGQPRKIGFHCDNEDIRYPYKPSTVSNFALILSSLFLPNVVIVLTNLKWSLTGLTTPNKREFLVALLESYGSIALFWMGIGFTQITIDTAKNNIGRLRPHFISVCKPNINCTLSENVERYITKYECTGTETELMKNSRVSFPSGHAALAFYSAVYVAIYLKQKSSEGNTTVPVTIAVIQVYLLQVAWFTSLSRVSDYMHHWSDVLVGAVAGALFAFLVITYVQIPNNRLILVDDHEETCKRDKI